MTNRNPYRNQIPVFQRVYNGNYYEREGKNGRIYVGVLGWRWFPSLLGARVGEPDGYKTKREAKEAAQRIIQRGRDD